MGGETLSSVSMAIEENVDIRLLLLSSVPYESSCVSLGENLEGPSEAG